MFKYLTLPALVLAAMVAAGPSMALPVSMGAPAALASGTMNPGIQTVDAPVFRRHFNGGGMNHRPMHGGNWNNRYHGKHGNWNHRNYGRYRHYRPYYYNYPNFGWGYCGWGYVGGWPGGCFPGYYYGGGYYGGYDDYDDDYVVVTKRVSHSKHVKWCKARYKTYNPKTDTFIGKGKKKYRCNSPYDGRR
ncbi:MAG: BA14K family protein [Hyphomicrobiales bacterium]